MPRGVQGFQALQGGSSSHSASSLGGASNSPPQMAQPMTPLSPDAFRHDGGANVGAGAATEQLQAVVAQPATADVQPVAEQFSVASRRFFVGVVFFGRTHWGAPGHLAPPVAATSRPAVADACPRVGMCQWPPS